MFKLIGGILIWLIGLLLFGIPLAFLSIYKVILTFFTSGRRIRRQAPGEEDVLHSLAVADCMFVPDSSWVKPVINFGFVLKLRNEGKKISISELREHFAKCFLSDEIEGGRYEKFLSYIVIRGGHGFRATRKSISLEDNILEVSLEEVDKQGKQMTVEGFIAEWLLAGYKVETPCWEMLLINLPKGQMVAFKIHHVFADGYSALNILDKLTDNHSPYLVKDFEEGALRQAKELIEGPLNMGKISGMPPDKNPFRVTLREKHEWMVSFTHFPLEELKRVRKKFGVHMSSVVITIMAGAMREFVKEGEWEKEIPEIMKFALTLAWPRHPSRDSRVLNKDKMCNHWVSGGLTIPFMELDPIKRMKLIEADFESLKRSGLDKFIKRVLTSVMWTLPGPVLSSALGDKDLGIQGGLTSLIGGDNYSLLGHSVDEIHPYLAIHDSNPYMPLSCFTFSHSGRMEVTFGAHPSVFKDQQRLDHFSHKLCHNELKLLLENSTSNEVPI